MRRFALATVVTCSLGRPLLAEDLGPGFAGYAMTFMAGLEAPSGQLFEMGTLAGTLDFEDDSSPLEHAALQCVGTFQANGQGQCAILTMLEGAADGQDTSQDAESDDRYDPGLNHLFASYECTEAAEQDIPAGAPGAQSCALTLIEGNGAFEGATGSVTFISAPPIAFHPDGSASGYAEITSFDLVLPQ